MSPELKVKWIAALRSGEYTQCFGVYYLYSYPIAGGGPVTCRYCPLGVLLKIGGVQAIESLPPDVVAYLIDRNDRARWSFARLADVIEVAL